MDVFEAIATKLEVRSFVSKKVPAEVKLKILEAARLTGSSKNTQHWRFVLVQDRSNLKRLASDSTSGKWVEGADFAIVILIDPVVGGSGIDAGRVVQDMQVAAWGFGVGSGIFTRVEEPSLRRDYSIPDSMKIAAVLGFGYPEKKTRGKKSRKPLEEIVYAERYGEMFDRSRLA